MKNLVNAAFARASAVLTARRELLERGARLLLEKETLVEADLAPFAAQAAATGDARQSPVRPLTPAAA